MSGAFLIIRFRLETATWPILHASAVAVAAKNWATTVWFEWQLGDLITAIGTFPVA